MSVEQALVTDRSYPATKQETQLSNVKQFALVVLMLRIQN